MNTLITPAQAVASAFTDGEYLAPEAIGEGDIAAAEQRYIVPVIGRAFHEKLLAGLHAGFTAEYLAAPVALFTRIAVQPRLDIRTGQCGTVAPKSGSYQPADAQSLRELQRSLRRQAQLLNLRPDLEILSLRGNVDTRLRKMKEGEYDAIVLASAGLKRLGLSADRMHHFEAASFVPAVGQGALGIECRGDDSEVLELLSRMEHRPTRICVEAERGFLAGLDGGCQVPIAGHAEMLDDDRFILDGLVAEVDGSVILREQQEGTAATARETGFALARHLLDKGGKDILDRLYAENR